MFTLPAEGIPNAIGIVFADVDEAGAQAAAEASKKLATHPNHKFQAYYIDVANAGIVQDAVRRTIEEFGHIDYLINGADVSVVRLQ